MYHQRQDEKNRAIAILDIIKENNCEETIQSPN